MAKNYNLRQRRAKRPELKETKHVGPTIIKSKKLFVITVGSTILLAIGVVIVHITSTVVNQTTKELVPPNPVEELPPSSSKLYKFKRGVVVSDAAPCAVIGRNILTQNGSAVDSAIATLFCNGLVNTQSMGLGGGCTMTIYERKTKKVHVLNAREAAPLNAKLEMYRKHSNLAKKGALSIGTPGELKGYWTAYLKFGRLSWQQLVQPTIDLCEAGYNMTQHQYDSLTFNSEKVRSDLVLSNLFVDKNTKQFYRPGTVIKRNTLCKTLKLIAEYGGDVFYSGELAEQLLDDLDDVGSLLTEQDLQSYRAKWEEPVTLELNDGHTLHSVNPPGGGATLAFILNVLDSYRLTARNLSTMEQIITTYHRIVETFKHAFAQRTRMGDLEFEDIQDIIAKTTLKSFGVEIRNKIKDDRTRSDPQFYGAVYYTPDDHGTAHINVVATDGDAVAVTSSINHYFGSGITSKQTGITLNSGMDDFSFPYYTNYFNLMGSPTNVMKPGKRSLSSMCPTIILDSSRELRLVVGAAGGTIIPTAVALVIIRHLWFGQNIKEAIDASRVHHQLLPMHVQYEYGVLDQVIKGLETLGHKTIRSKEPSVVNAIAKLGELYYANMDYRKTGEVSGLDEG